MFINMGVGKIKPLIVVNLAAAVRLFLLVAGWLPVIKFDVRSPSLLLLNGGSQR